MSDNASLLQRGRVVLLLVWVSLVWVQPSNCLKIWIHSEESSVRKIFFHQTAAFGPGEFNVSAPLSGFDPENGCDIEDTLSTLKEKRRPLNSFLEGDIVLLTRGSCPFAQKVLNMQLLGAAGVVVGNDANGKDELIRMTLQNGDSDGKHKGSKHKSKRSGESQSSASRLSNLRFDTLIHVPAEMENTHLKKSEKLKVKEAVDDGANGDEAQIEIPSIFVGFNEYTWIRKEVLKSQHCLDRALRQARLLETSNRIEVKRASLRRKLAANRKGADGKLKSGFESRSTLKCVTAMMDATGEYVAGNVYYDNIVVLGYLLLVVPVIWCAITAVVVAKRGVLSAYGKYKRRKKLRTIPIVKYTGCRSDYAQTGSRNVGLKETEEQVDLEDESSHSECHSSCVVDDDSESDDDEENESMKKCRMKNAGIHASGGGVLGVLKNWFARRSKWSLQPHNDACAICLDDFEVGTLIKLLPCKHGFHPTCVDPWLAKRSELCPMCKQSIFIDDSDEDDRDCASVNSAAASWFSSIEATPTPPSQVAFDGALTRGRQSVEEENAGSEQRFVPPPIVVESTTDETQWSEMVERTADSGSTAMAQWLRFRIGSFQDAMTLRFRSSSRGAADVGDYRRMDHLTPLQSAEASESAMGNVELSGGIRI